MRYHASMVLLFTLLVSGCAMPRWVPFLGKKGDPSNTASAAKTTARKPAASGVTATTPPTTTPEPSQDKKAVARDDNIADRVIAVVNNDAITEGELLQSILAYKAENRQATGQSDDEIRDQFLNRLIENRLELQEADREKITVDDVEVDEELTDRIKKFGAPSREEFEKVVKDQGLTMDEIKKRIRETLRMAKVIRRKVTLRISVTPDEIDKYLAENRPKLETGLSYHARHILITPDGTGGTAWDAARARAEAVRTQLVGGADFGELARQISGDSSARDGGDLGTLKRGELAEDIERQIVSLQTGEISQAYRSSLGYHIFRLESKEDLQGDSLTRVRQQIQDILFRQKYESRFETWLKEIKQRAIIERRM